jgi:hypothetical protein
LIDRRQSQIDYHAFVAEFLRIIAQPWTCIHGSRHLWCALDRDTQRICIRNWLVKHTQHEFERHFKLLLCDAYVTTLQTDEELDAEELDTTELDAAADLHPYERVHYYANFQTQMISNMAVFFLFGGGICIAVLTRIYLTVIQT